MADITINTKYKDRLFRLRFGSIEYRENILSLYNALNGTSYRDADELSITTIDDVIYIGMKNDVSLLLGGEHAPLGTAELHQPEHAGPRTDVL